nr:ABC transporter substrate-binding protein [Nakamurella flavida]
MAANGTLAPDPDVVDSVTVRPAVPVGVSQVDATGAVTTAGSPFTVTYALDRRAAWSDGTPITAEDFAYLRDQMVSQAGAEAPAGYRLITAVRSRDAGKTVDVEFAEPFAEWRTLFSPLLPSHIMKDSPGGWSAALATELPVSGNRYKMDSYNAVTGEITLVRNDKFWGAPPGPASVVLRQGGPSDLVAGLERGDLQAVLVGPGADSSAALAAAVPQERRVTVAEPASVQLVFDTTTGPAAEQDIRRAVAAALDLDRLRAVLSGQQATAYPTVTSQVRLPATGAPVAPGSARVPSDDTTVSTPGDRTTSTEPASSGSAGEPVGPPITTGNADAATALLAGAGFRRTGLYAARDGQVLRMTLAYPQQDARLTAAALEIQTRLGAAGIEIDLRPDAPSTIVEDLLPAGTVDLALLTVPRGFSDTVSAASAFGCPTQDAPVADAAVPVLPPRVGNLSGYCAPDLQETLTDALAGRVDVTEADDMLWSALPVLPVAEPTTTFAVAPELASVITTERRGWVWTGPLAGLAEWPTP